MVFDESIDEGVLDAYLDPLEEDDRMLGDFASECDDDEEEDDLDDNPLIEAVNKTVDGGTPTAADGGTETEADVADKKRSSQTSIGAVTTKLSHFASNITESIPPVKMPRKFKKVGKMVVRKISATAHMKHKSDEIHPVLEEEPDAPQNASEKEDERVREIDNGEPKITENEDGDKERNSMEEEKDEDTDTIQPLGDEKKMVDVNDEASLIENYYLTSSFVSYSAIAEEIIREEVECTTEGTIMQEVENSTEETILSMRESTNERANKEEMESTTEGTITKKEKSTSEGTIIKEGDLTAERANTEEVGPTTEGTMIAEESTTVANIADATNSNNMTVHAGNFA